MTQQHAATREASRKDHLPYEVRHVDDAVWETIRWPGQMGKMLFHPRPERPTEPNAGIVRYEPGSYHPEHYHGFAQVWYILSGEFTIEGKLLKPGTMLTATILTTTQPVTVRTASSLTGTVWYVSGNYVILTLDNGENHEYTVPPSFKFMVEGKPATVGELRKGMKVSATKIVEQPHTEISTQGFITGKAPK